MKLKLSLSLLLLCGVACAQQNDVKNIAKANPPEAALAPLRYLASDELKGRNIERPEINVAAQYIADQFNKIGAKPVQGTSGYFQFFKLKFITASTHGQVTLGPDSFVPGVDVFQADPGDVKLSAPIVYAGTGLKTDIDAVDVKDKVVIVDIGEVNQNNVSRYIANINGLQKTLKDKGAVGLVEHWNAGASLWQEIQGYLTRSRPIDSIYTVVLPALLINSPKLDQWLVNTPGQVANITISGTSIRELALKNVMAEVQGTDPKLHDQYLLLSSHYDHLGVTANPKMEEGKLDSIYNGARDNATGTTAVIAAARYFAKYPPKRSVLFITYTAEEEGLLGSIYYADHPVVPLAKTVYNLNIDNASYNDTTLITLVGIGRTSADPHILAACKAYGLHVNDDPTGGHLFSGSDNFPLAGKGIPAPTFSLGMKTFDETITNRYHQLSDEVGNMDLNYIIKFINSYTLAAKLIADDPAQPTWSPGDKYEAAWKSLFKQ